MPLRVEVIINAGSGSVTEEKADEIKDLLSAAGVDARVSQVTSGADIKDLVTRAMDSNADVIAAAGGDGTVSAVASMLIGSSKTLGVLPLGTLNNFSKDLGIPQDLEGAVAVLAADNRTRIDVGNVNGTYFINNSSIGLYPRIVLHRERQQRLGRGKWWAAAWAALRMLRISPFVRVKLMLEDKEISRKAPFVFIGNNEYEMDLYNIGRRAELNKGVLSIYLLSGGGRWGVVVMVVRTFLGLLRQTKDFEELRTRELTIEMRRKRVLVATDGEVSVMEAPLKYKIEPEALNVIVPRPE
jgi:diacylglycerol kinase family enzyme